MTCNMLMPAPVADDETWTLEPADLPVVSSADDVHDVLMKMQRHCISRILVADPGGRLRGVLEQADLLPCDGLPGQHAVRDVLTHSATPSLRLQSELNAT